MFDLCKKKTDDPFRISFLWLNKLSNLFVREIGSLHIKKNKKYAVYVFRLTQKYYYSIEICIPSKLEMIQIIDVTRLFLSSYVSS